MSNLDFSAESPENYEQKSICCFVVDVSGSMGGEPIRELNIGLREFHKEIKNDSMISNRLEIAIVKFGSTVETVLQPAIAHNFDMPGLLPRGTTKLVDGMKAGIELVKSRKDWYKNTGQPYLRPWIVLITDGSPDPGQDVLGLAAQIEQETKNSEYFFFPIGVQDADMEALSQIAGYEKDGQGGWQRVEPAKLEGLKFSSFFKWVSASISIVASSKDGAKVDLPAPSWMKGFKIE